MAKDQGITMKKDQDVSEWYTQVVIKSGLIDYSGVSGCYVLKPLSYQIWEKIQKEFDKKIKKKGVKNCYFPLLIPESLLKREQQHIAGFEPEVAYVTQAGSTKLDERLAIRPTSETIMYDSYSKWIRSHRDLPLRLNQWNNVVRWEFKHPTPFLRGREFLWNEGHTAFATKKEAEAEKDQIIGIYKEVCDNYLALPSLIGKKSEKEKFAGAEYTVSMEFLMPHGKAVQGPDFHHDGQIFARAFEITFLDEKGQKQYVWQNTWAISTRMLGVLFAVHSDDKGLVLPPRVASTPVVIVPILFDDSQAKVLKEVQKIKEALEKKGISVHMDDRDGYSPGWKFNEWEMKGVPVRMELGPKDLEKKQALVVRRDTGEKQALSLAGIDAKIKLLLEQMQQDLHVKAEKFLHQSIVKAENLKDAEKAVNAGKIAFTPWCGTDKCEEKWKERTNAKTLNSPLEQPKMKNDQLCFACKENANSWFYVGKSY